MPDLCKDYDIRGYCLRGKECPDRHSSDLIQLDVSNYGGLMDAVQRAKTLSKLQQNDLKRKQTDLLRNLVCQQKALIDKIELCSNEAEKLRLKTALNGMSQKTKDWIEAQTQQHQHQQTNSPSTSALISQASTSSTITTTSTSASTAKQV